MLKDRAVLLLALGQTLIWAGMFYIFPASLLFWEQDLGWSRSDLTFAITLAILASGLAAPLAGRLIDGGRGPAMMGGGAVLGGLCLIAVSRVATLWQFYALWIAIGVLMAGTLYEATFAMITRARGAEAKQGIIRITLIAGFAGSLSFPSVHFLSQTLGWRGATAGIGVFIVCVVAPVLWSGARLLAPPPRPAPAPATTQKPARHGYLRQPVFWLLGTGFAVTAIVHGATLQHLLPMLNERGLPPEFAVLIAAMIGPMQVVGRLGMVAVGTRLSHYGFAMATFGFLGLSILILLLAGSERGLVVGFVLIFGSAYGTVSILRPVIARDLLGEADFGAKSGGLAVLYMAAAASSAWIGALIWGIGGYNVMLMLLIGLAALGALLFGAAHRLAAR